LTEARTGSTRGWIALAVVALTVVVGVGALATLVVGHHRSGSWFSAGDSAQVPGETERARVEATAEQFCLRVDQFDGSNPDAYRKSVTAMLTTKYKAEFDKSFQQVEQLGIQSGQKGQGAVKASGIQDLDSDSATVLVAHDNTITSPDGTVQRHHRWVVSLVKVGGKWLVDDFTQVS
jgi:hypothetical protein